jgi:ATP-dependent helicase/DNAse subunit B
MKLIRGAPGSGKTALVFREFKEALRTGRTELRIVVPTATLVRHFQHELARDGVVFSPHSVVSLSRFVKERAAETELVPDGLLHAIVRDTLRRNRFPEFAGVEATDGMTALAVDTIGLFENAACTPDQLGAVRRSGPHAKAFLRLWRAVNERVRECGYRTRTEVTRAAGANTKTAKIWLDGFLNFSPLERELVRSLANVCDMTLTMTDSPSADDIRRFALKLGAEERLLAGPSRKPQTTLIEAPALEREADEIARRIVALHRQGTPFREIGVAIRDAGTYLPLLRGTFERFGIPAHFYFSTPLRKHPVAIFLGGLISGALNDWNFEAALETLRAHPGWGHAPDFDRFDFAVREAMPGRGAAALLQMCERDWLRDEIAACLKTEAWKNTPRKPAAWQTAFESLAASLYRPGVLEAPRDHAGVETARSHVSALRAWSTAIAAAAAFWNSPDANVSLEEFWRVAADIVESIVVQPAGDRSGVVHVMSVYEARQWDLACLFVCGMTDRDFPRRHPQNLLFPDGDIERLYTAIPLRRAADEEREEQFLFDSLKTRATTSLFLTVPEKDATGKSVERSRWLIDFTGATERARICIPEPRFTPAVPAIAGRVESPALQAAMAELHKQISLTALEDLAQCRFKFFARKTLGLKPPPKRPGERLNALVTGSILHLALERWLADKSRDFVELFELVFDETCAKERLPAGYKLEVERIRFREIARRVSANDLWDAESRPEVGLTLQFPGGVAVTCRVDRIDVFPNNDCVIVDYKSSKTASVQKLVTSRTRLQGPLYALAAREELNLNPVAMIYWAVREDERYGWGSIPGTDLEFQPMPPNWAEDARIRTIERLSGFLRGEVHAHPEEAEYCRWCDYRNACRVEQYGEQQTLVMIEGAHGA